MENLFAHSHHKSIINTTNGVKTVANKSRLTVAAISTRGKLKLGVSRCSMNDIFDKNIGRNLALKRARNNALITITIPNKANHKLLFFKIAEGLMDAIEDDPSIVSLQK